MEKLVEYDRLVHDLTLSMIKKQQKYRKLLEKSKVDDKVKSKYVRFENEKQNVVKTILQDLKQKNKNSGSYNMKNDVKDIKALMDYLGKE